MLGQFQFVREHRVLFIGDGSEDVDPRTALRERAARIPVEITLGGPFAAGGFGDERRGETGLLESVALRIDRGLQIGADLQAANGCYGEVAA